MLYENCAANKLKSCAALQSLSGKRPKTFNWRKRMRAKTRRKMLQQCLKLRWEGRQRGFFKDRVLYFEVCGGTVCSAQSPNPSSIRLFFTAMFAHYVFMGWFQTPESNLQAQESELQGNRNEGETLMYFQVGCQHRLMPLTSEILLWIQLIPWHVKNMLLWFGDWQVTVSCLRRTKLLPGCFLLRPDNDLEPLTSHNIPIRARFLTLNLFLFGLDRELLLLIQPCFSFFFFSFFSVQIISQKYV